MDIVVLFNGLGNQMSQYAFYLAKKERNEKCQVIFNTKCTNGHHGYELGKLFGIHCESGTKHDMLEFFYRIVHSERFLRYRSILSRFGLNIIYEEQNYDFNPALLLPSQYQGLNYYWGGWHSEKNFQSVEKKVREVFQFPKITDENCLRFADLIESAENSVSLHVRRGDYLKAKPDDFYHFDGVATLDYYEKAVAYIKNKFGNCKFFVFSNDLEWCKKEFSNLDAAYVDCNSGENSWRDMYLMSLCKHHINANSTFSWWGAWLSNKNGVTICPKMFLRTVVTNDIYPERWVKI
jgi:hypothetical protein